MSTPPSNSSVSSPTGTVGLTVPPTFHGDRQPRLSLVIEDAYDESNRITHIFTPTGTKVAIHPSETPTPPSLPSNSTNITPSHHPNRKAPTHPPSQRSANKFSRPSSSVSAVPTSPQPSTPHYLPPLNRPITPLSNVLPSRHASARIGTVFGGDGDITAFQREWQLAQDQEVNEQEASECETSKLNDSTDDPSIFSSTLTSAASSALLTNPDAMTDADWDAVLGIRAPLPSTYDHQQYLTVDDDIHEWESSARSTKPTPRKRPPLKVTMGSKRMSILPVSHSVANLLPNSLSTLRPAKVSSHLHGLDVEHSHTISPAKSHSNAMMAQSIARTIPIKLNFEQVTQLEHNTIQRITQQHQQQQQRSSAPSIMSISPIRSHRSNKTEEKESLGLLHSASSSLSTAPSSLYQLAASPGVINYLDAAFTQPGDVLEPSSRYEQLVRACQQIVPPVSSIHATSTLPPTTAQPSTTNRSRVGTHRSPAKTPIELSRQSSAILPSPASTIASASPFSSIASTPISSTNHLHSPYRHASASASPAILGSSPSPLATTNGMSDPLRRPQIDDQQHSTESSNAVKHRKPMRTEFLNELSLPSSASTSLASNSTDSINSSLTSPGLSSLSILENDRILTHRVSEAKLLTLGSGGSRVTGEEAEFSSAAIMAAQQLQASRLAISTTSEGHHGQPLAVAPNQLALTSSSSHPVLSTALSSPSIVMVHRTSDPSPAADSGHSYMKTHALHHHVKLVTKKSPSLTSSASMMNFPLPLANSSSIDVGPPLPSTSPALQLQSPSSKPGWHPPSLACSTLAEKIYQSSRRLSGLISHGEEEQLFEKHLTQIKPSHLMDEARKRSMAAAAIEKMKALAADQKAKAIRSKVDSGTALLLARQEARDAAKRERAAREAEEDARLMEEITRIAAQLEEEEREEAKRSAQQAQEKVANTNKPAAKKSSKLSHSFPRKDLSVSIPVGVNGPVLEESVSVDLEPIDTSQSISPSSSSTLGSGRSTGWSRVRSLTDRSVTLSQTNRDHGAEVNQTEVESIVASPLARKKFQHEMAKVKKTERQAEVNQLKATLGEDVFKPASFSIHRIPPIVSVSSHDRISRFGPKGEDLTGHSVLTPSSFIAGHILDTSISAADERHTADEKRKLEQSDYTNCLARLYRRVTPQEKRLKRLDQRKASREDLRSIVAETLGEYQFSAKKRFT